MRNVASSYSRRTYHSFLSMHDAVQAIGEHLADGVVRAIAEAMSFAHPSEYSASLTLPGHFSLARTRSPANPGIQSYEQRPRTGEPTGMLRLDAGTYGESARKLLSAPGPTSLLYTSERGFNKDSCG